MQTKKNSNEVFQKFSTIGGYPPHSIKSSKQPVSQPLHLIICPYFFFALSPRKKAGVQHFQPMRFGISLTLHYFCIQKNDYMITFPNAKINIGLQVTERRPDGYHNLDTIFYPIPLHDALEVIEAKGAAYDCRLHLSGVDIAGSLDSNLVVRAYRLLSADHHLPSVDIYLHKHIPTGAGLGGGSADASYMLRLLNEQFALGISSDRLTSYAAQLGADCPFFIHNTPVYATGTGNIFHPLELSLAGYTIVIVKPDIFVSTKEAFSQIRPARPSITLDKKIHCPIQQWRHIITNDFEDGIFALHPELSVIKERLYALGAVYASMSGSGSALYGIFTQDIPHIERHFEGCFCEQYKL